MNKINILLTLPFIFLSFLSFGIEENKDEILRKGLIVYKKANCMGCHSWHGKGGGGYGAGVSLREPSYEITELINIIKCGIPGTGMPYFDKKSYKTEKCYGTLKEDYTETEMPKNSITFLNERQIKSLATFVYTELQNKELDKQYCVKFFKKGSKICENL